MTTQLTPLQARVYFHIRASIKQRGIPPTLRELRADCGVASVSSIHYAINALVRKGKLCKERGSARALSLPVKVRSQQQTASLEREAAVWLDLGCVIRWDVNASGVRFGFTAWKQPTPDAAHKLVAEVGITGTEAGR